MIEATLDSNPAATRKVIAQLGKEFGNFDSNLHAIRSVSNWTRPGSALGGEFAGQCGN
jgi:hypothetical protein